MYLVRRIVVGVEMPPSHPWNAADVEAPSQMAVRQAFQVAQASRIPVSLVTVLPEQRPGWFGAADYSDADNKAAVAEAEAVLHALVLQHGGSADQSAGVECLVRSGRPWLELLRVAGNAADTMIVCGTRHKSALSNALFGSTGLKLLRNAAGPVWLAQPRPDSDDRLEILATTDLSDVGLDVLLTGVALAKLIPARLSVLHVDEGMVDRYVRRTGMSDEQINEYQRQSFEQAEHAVHDQLAATDFRTLEQGVRVHVASGPPDACILKALDDLKTDLLIMATRGRGGVTGMLLGNTAERLLAEVSCSLIALKPDDFVSPVDLT